MNNQDFIWIEIGIFSILSLSLICLSEKKERNYNIVDSERYSSLIIILMLIISVVGYVINDFKRSLQIEFGVVVLWALFNCIRVCCRFDINKVFESISSSSISEIIGVILFILLVLTYIFVSIQCFIVFEFLLIVCLIWMIYSRNG